MGVYAPHLGQQRRKNIGADRHTADETHRPAQRFAFVANTRDGVLQVAKDAVAQLQKGFTGRGNPDPPSDAVKHRLAELIFEQENLPADCRLRDVQLLAGGRERAGIGYGPDDLELPQVHGRQHTFAARMDSR